MSGQAGSPGKGIPQCMCYVELISKEVILCKYDFSRATQCNFVRAEVATSCDFIAILAQFVSAKCQCTSIS